MWLLSNATNGAAGMVVGTADGFCANTANIWQLVGNVLLIFKIVIPILLIVLGMVDLGKAVVSSDDKAISKAAKTLMMRAIAAVIVFFVPSLVSFVFTAISAFNSEVKADYDICKKCIVHPNGSKDTAETCGWYVTKMDS